MPDKARWPFTMIHDLPSMTYLASNVSQPPLAAVIDRNYTRVLMCWVKSVSAESISVTKSAALGSKMHISLSILWHTQPCGKLLTSLLREAFRCNGLLDMKNCQVVSAQGWGPGFSGAYCTLRISRRAEFLGSSRGQHGGTLCLAEAAALHSHVLTHENSTDKWGKAEQATTVHYWTTHPL